MVGAEVEGDVLEDVAELSDCSDGVELEQGVELRCLRCGEGLGIGPVGAAGVSPPVPDGASGSVPTGWGWGAWSGWMRSPLGAGSMWAPVVTPTQVSLLCAWA